MALTKGAGHGADGTPWRVHDPHRSHPARRRRTDERCGGARANGREGPVPRPRDAWPGRRRSALDHARRELTMTTTAITSGDSQTRLPGSRLRRVTEYIQAHLD